MRINFSFSTILNLIALNYDIRLNKKAEESREKHYIPYAAIREISPCCQILTI